MEYKVEVNRSVTKGRERNVKGDMDILGVCRKGDWV